MSWEHFKYQSLREIATFLLFFFLYTSGGFSLQIFIFFHRQWESYSCSTVPSHFSCGRYRGKTEEMKLGPWILCHIYSRTSSDRGYINMECCTCPQLGNSVTIIGIYQRLSEKEKTQDPVKRDLSTGDNFVFVGTLWFSIVFWGLFIFWLIQLLKCSVAKATS